MDRNSGISALLRLTGFARIPFLLIFILLCLSSNLNGQSDSLSPIAIPNSKEYVSEIYRMTLRELIDESGLKAVWSDSIKAADFQVVSFDMKVIVGDVIIIEHADSGEFTDKHKSIFYSMRPGHKLILEKITAIGPDGRSHDLDPFSIWIK